MTAYKGYVIRTSPFRPQVTVSKDGQHISTHQDIEEAKRTIDMLADIGATW